ncbi:MAG: hypothetical protein II690_04880 [Ruminococcus sp.]|nr:hypothetical protein [Ruminococcus sp.]
MNKDEILAMSREENKDKRKDPYELEIASKSSNVALVVSAIIAGILYLMEMVVTGNENYSLWSVLCTMDAVIYMYRGIKLKNKMSIFCGILWLILAIASGVSAVSHIMRNRL